jgi:2'-5' RNA ligase
MRLFTGIEIHSDALPAVTNLIERLRPLADLRWTPPEKLHLTTTFIGEWPEERLQELKSALAGMGASGPVVIALKGLGVLPNPRFPRTLYAGVEHSEPLTALARKTSETVSILGVSVEDRIYRPHVTLARVRGRPKLEKLQPELGSFPIASFEARSFFLYL